MAGIEGRGEVGLGQAVGMEEGADEEKVWWSGE